MIRNFLSKVAQDIYDGVSSRHSRRISLELHNKTRRLLDQLDIIKDIDELRAPPSNRLEKLSGNLKNFWSLRINVQFRIIFKWENGVAYDVDIVDYH